MPVSVARQDIDYYSGDSRTKAYAFTENGVAIDLSGKELVLTIKKEKGGEEIAALTTDSEITVGGDDNNVVNIAFNHEFEERRYYHDLYNITDDYTLMYGNLNAIKEIHS